MSDAERKEVKEIFMVELDALKKELSVRATVETVKPIKPLRIFDQCCNGCD